MFEFLNKTKAVQTEESKLFFREKGDLYMKLPPRWEPAGTVIRPAKVNKDGVIVRAAKVLKQGRYIIRAKLIETRATYNRKGQSV